MVKTLSLVKYSWLHTKRPVNFFFRHPENGCSGKQLMLGLTKGIMNSQTADN